MTIAIGLMLGALAPAGCSTPPVPLPAATYILGERESDSLYVTLDTDFDVAIYMDWIVQPPGWCIIGGLLDIEYGAGLSRVNPGQGGCFGNTNLQPTCPTTQGGGRERFLWFTPYDQECFDTINDKVCRLKFHANQPGTWMIQAACLRQFNMDYLLEGYEIDYCLWEVIDPNPPRGENDGFIYTRPLRVIVKKPGVLGTPTITWSIIKELYR